MNEKNISLMLKLVENIVNFMFHEVNLNIVFEKRF